MKKCLEVKYNYTRKIRFSRLIYYLLSLFKIIKAVHLKNIFPLLYSLLSDRKATVELKNGLVFNTLSSLDILTLKEVVLDEEYESFGIKVEKEDKIIIDIGAGFGDFTILVARKYPHAKIYAFEPDRRYFKLLEENLLLNRIKNVIPSSEQVYSLKQIFNPIQSNPISSFQCDFLKMDCEGCEFSIINKKDLTCLKRIKKLVIEYHESKNWRVDKIISILEKAKFEVKVFPRKQVKNSGLLTAFV